MKKTLLAIAAIHLFTLSSFAQKNIAKVNLSGLAIRSYSAQYERQISKRFTVAIGYSTIPNGGLPFSGYINDVVDNPDVEIGRYKIGTSVITPEVRFYVGKHGALRGFYLAPYARISTYNLEGPVKFSGSTQRKEAYFTGKLNNTTGGLMLGSQFRLSNRIYLDWWIIGASIGSAEGNLVASVQLDPYEQQQLKNVLDGVDVPFTKISNTVNSNGATVTTTGSMLGARGLGINLGFRF
jgi:hypothetical protein